MTITRVACPACEGEGTVEREVMASHPHDPSNSTVTIACPTCAGSGDVEHDSEDV